MVSATFRFHDELNDFLAPFRRGHEFTVPCAEAATTKHMIEALGVPHTEVARILVNGEPAGFDRLLREGDRVTVHPRAGAMDAPLLHGHATRDPRFVADAHLGGLARMLRMLGFDTLYDNHAHDDAIVEICERDGRIVLTRDRELLKRRAVARGCYVHALKSEDQLREIVERLDLARSARPFTRCLHCNVPLRPVDKASVLDRLPPRVREHYAHFSTCDACGRVYWEGSHWRNMRRMLDGLLNNEDT
ncbi:MAG: twitching motility protein PilT [Betaproteobacteria bacterium]|nr:twitching motility protein PilT [Betaproteobacteria bacterium]